MTHHTDLHDIDRQLGELDDDTACRLIMAGLRGGRIECWDGKKWYVTNIPSWLRNNKYRLARPAPVADIIPWDAVHRDFNWYARDKDGPGWLFRERPFMRKDDWIDDGGAASSEAIAGIIPGNLPWDQSLVCRPGWEGK